MTSHSDASASHNEAPLSRDLLYALLNDLQARTLREFGRQVRLFVHGGAVMILHPSLSSSSTRRTTRDIDYLGRALGHEWRKRGVHDAEKRLRACIAATTVQFRVGPDWMNADADVALPFARDPGGHMYDPIYHDAKQENNVALNTIYTAPGLQLVAVTMFWGVALKLVRYQKDDPADIAAMLRHGTRLNGVQWTPRVMEEWIRTLCWPMGYAHYGPAKEGEMRHRINDAVARARVDGLHRTEPVPSRHHPPPPPNKIIHAPVPSQYHPLPSHLRPVPTYIPDHRRRTRAL